MHYAYFSLAGTKDINLKNTIGEILQYNCLVMLHINPQLVLIQQSSHLKYFYILEYILKKFHFEQKV